MEQGSEQSIDGIFFTEASSLKRKENLLRNTEREYLPNGEKAECLNQ